MTTKRPTANVGFFENVEVFAFDVCRRRKKRLSHAHTHTHRQ